MIVRQKYKVLNAVSSVDEGPWVKIVQAEHITLHVFGMLAGDIVQIWGSNEDEEIPLNPVQIDVDITDNGMYEISKPIAKLQVRLSDDSGGGTVTAIMMLR